MTPEPWIDIFASAIVIRPFGLNLIYGPYVLAEGGDYMHGKSYFMIIFFNKPLYKTNRLRNACRQYRMQQASHFHSSNDSMV